jgi:hypothetical protein
VNGLGFKSLKVSHPILHKHTSVLPSGTYLIHQGWYLSLRESIDAACRFSTASTKLGTEFTNTILAPD